MANAEEVKLPRIGRAGELSTMRVDSRQGENSDEEFTRSRRSTSWRNTTHSAARVRPRMHEPSHLGTAWHRETMRDLPAGTERRRRWRGAFRSAVELGIINAGWFRVGNRLVAPRTPPRFAAGGATDREEDKSQRRSSGFCYGVRAEEEISGLTTRVRMAGLPPRSACFGEDLLPPAETISAILGKKSSVLLWVRGKR
jgi:hypothetical protein